MEDRPLSISKTLIAVLAACSAHAQRSTWTLVWRDEFAGTSVDTTKWGFDLGNGFYGDSGRSYVSGWGNNELQCYTRNAGNAAVHDGALHIRAVRAFEEPVFEAGVYQ